MAGNQKRKRPSGKGKAKKDEKRKAKKREVSRREHESRSLVSRIRRASSWPVFKCFITEGWREEKVAEIVLARERGRGVAVAFFRVDLLCLGVTDALFHEAITREEFLAMSEELAEVQPVTPCSLEFALKVLESGLVYARELGFPPARDYSAVRDFFGDAKLSDVSEEVECGDEGRPTFVARPSDDIPRILSQLEEKVGPDGFHFIPLEELDEEMESSPGRYRLNSHGLEVEDAPLGLSAEAAEEWRAFRMVESEACGRLLEEFVNTEGPEMIEAVMDEFYLWPEGQEGLDRVAERKPLEFDSVFLSWLLFTWDPDSEDGFYETPLAFGDSLNLRGLSDEASDFMGDASASPFSFYCVTDVIPDQSFRLRDLLTGYEVEVAERSATHGVQRGAILYTRVIPLDGMNLMQGCAPIALPPSSTTHIVELRNGIRNQSRTGEVKVGALMEFEIEIREAYLALSNHCLHPSAPQMQNTDDEALVLSSIEYELHCEPDEAVRDLVPLATGRSEADILEDVERDDQGRFEAVEFAWLRPGNSKHEHWEVTVLGHLRISQQDLTVEVNSEERAAGIKKKIGELLGKRATLVRESIKSFKEILEARGDRAEPTDEDFSSSEEQEVDFASTPEAKEFMRQHWAVWLDTTIPMLRDQTPREAARTPEGRELLEALFCEYAWKGSGGNLGDFPEEEMRRTLGVPREASVGSEDRGE